MSEQLLQKPSLSVETILKQNIPFGEKFKLLRKLAQEKRELDLELDAIFSKKTPCPKGLKPADVLKRHNLPEISTEFRKLLDEKLAKLDPRYVKDGFVYTFRGDFSGLEKKGIYSFNFFETNLSLDQYLEQVKNDPLLVHLLRRPRNKLEEFMLVHSNGGYESFLSTSPNFQIANLHPKYKKKRWNCLCSQNSNSTSIFKLLFCCSWQ